MTTWQQTYPGQGAPPPAGFQIPNPSCPPHPGYGQPGYPPQSGYPDPQFAGFPNPHFAHPEMYGSAENGESYIGGSDFNDQNIRRGFIRKVYSILLCQILITIALMAPFLFHQRTRFWAQQNPWIHIVLFIAIFVVLLTLACCEGPRRKYPWNFILLSIFTILEGCSLGVISARYDADEVLIAMGITAVVCFALTLFAFQTKWDFTVMGSGLLICLVVFTLFGILAAFLRYPILNLVYSCIGAIIFSLYLVYDTQLMMGGSHKYSISPEEYIFAALSLYVDIINLFLFILRITGYARD